MNNFWDWFKLNQDKYYNFSKVDKTIESHFDLLSSELSRINPDLTFEFGPKSKVREIVISAGGHKASFNDVVQMVKAAPKLDNWKVIQFRPRRKQLNIVEFKSVNLDPSETYYTITVDKDKLGVILFNQKYIKAESKEWENAFYLMLDEILGEFDVEMKVGFILFATPNDSKLGKYYDSKNPVAHMASHFDDAWTRLTSHHTGENHE